MSKASRNYYADPLMFVRHGIPACRRCAALELCPGLVICPECFRLLMSSFTVGVDNLEEFFDGAEEEAEPGG